MDEREMDVKGPYSLLYGTTEIFLEFCLLPPPPQFLHYL